MEGLKIQSELHLLGWPSQSPTINLIDIEKFKDHVLQMEFDGKKKIIPLLQFFLQQKKQTKKNLTIRTSFISAAIKCNKVSVVWVLLQGAGMFLFPPVGRPNSHLHPNQ